MAKKINKSQVADKGPVGFALFAAWIGALVYFVNQSQGIGGFVLAFLKACIWPAYLLYHLLQVLHV